MTRSAPAAAPADNPRSAGVPGPTKADGIRHYRALGIAALRRGQIKAAIGQFRRAWRFDPGYAPALQQFGESLAQQGDLTEARAALEAAIARKPDFPWSHYHLAKVLDRAGDGEEALPHYARAAELKPDFFWAYQDWGEALVKAGQFDAAAEALARAAALNPQFSWCHHHRARALAALGRLEEAVTAYRRAIALEPSASGGGFPWNHANLGDVLAALERWDEAAIAYREALRCQPDLPGLSRKLMAALAMQTEGSLARALQEAGPAADDDRAKVRDCYLRLEADRDDPERYAALADALAAAGDRLRALVYYKIALQIDPALARAREGLAAARPVTAP